MDAFDILMRMILIALGSTLAVLAVQNEVYGAVPIVLWIAFRELRALFRDARRAWAVSGGLPYWI